MKNELNYTATRVKNNDRLFLVLFIFLFFIAQSVYSFVYAHNYPLRNDNNLQIILRFSIWTIPVFVYLILIKKNPFNYLKFCKNIIKGIVWGTVIGAIIVIYSILSSFILKGHVFFNFNIGKGLWLKAILLVGFSEEVLFRGFLLQKVSEISKFWAANVINAVLFVLVHVIGWIMLRQFIMPAAIGPICSILIFGLIQGLVLKKSNSLWACIIIHSFNNFASIVIMGNSI